MLWKMGTGEFSFCGKWERENSRFVENQRGFFFLSENSPIVENRNPRILFFFLSENSRFVENQDWRIFFFFLM